MAEKQVRFTVDGTQAESYMQRMRQSASGLAREMITASEGMGKTGRDVLKDVEDQIKAIEKRNSLYLDIQKRELAANLGSDKLSQTDYDRSLTNLEQGNDEDKTQTQLLRELIDAVKVTSKSEIREDREGVRDQLDAFKKGDGVDEDEFDRLKLLLQGDEFVGEGRKEDKKGGGLGGVSSALNDMAGARNIGDIASYGGEAAGQVAARVGPGGIIGLIIGLVGGAVLKTVLGQLGTLESASRDYAILTDQSISGVIGGVRGMDKSGMVGLGMSPSQYFEKEAGYRRAFKGGDVNTLDLAGLEKARGLSGADISGLLGVQRYEGGTIDTGVPGVPGVKSGSPIALASFFERYLIRTGQDISVLPEILQQFAQEAKVIISTQGEVNSRSLATVIAGMGTAFGLKGENLSRVVGGIRGGMQRQQNPVIQALQFESMSQVTPGASLWDLEVAMENPLENPMYINQYLTNLRKMSGGGDMYKRAIFNTFGQFGISKTDAGRIAEGEDFLNIINRSSGIGDYVGKTNMVQNIPIDYRSEAENKFVGALEKSTAAFSSLKQSLGTKGVEQAIRQLNVALSRLDGTSDAYKDAVVVGVSQGIQKGVNVMLPIIIAKLKAQRGII